MTNQSTVYRLPSTEEQKKVVGGRWQVDQKGFTLIEILVTIVIMSLVFGIIVSSITAINKRTRDQQRTTDLLNLQASLAQYYADQTFFPDGTFNLGSATQLDNDVGNPQVPPTTRLYQNKIPKDPQGTAYCYRPQASFSGGSCDNATPATECHFYRLCAHFENPTSGAADCATACGVNFNGGVDPQNSATQ